MPTEPLVVALYNDIVLPNEYRLRAKADFPIEVIRVPDSASQADREAAVAAADAIVTVAFAQPAQQAPRLRLVQTQAAGVERVDLSCLPDRVTVCNAFGHTRAIAEYTLMTMLMWTHQWKAVESSFRAGSWFYSGSKYGPLRHELNSRTVGVLGFGQMGEEIARRCHALGTRVLVCARNPGKVVDTLGPGGVGPTGVVEQVVGLDQLDPFLGQCDFVVVCLALTPDTRGLIQADRLARMKPDAVLINVARGPIVDEAALYEALTRPSIGGAVIDVWWQYPDAAEPERRGAQLPFHELDNVLITPHSSGWTEQMMDRRWDQIVANLAALAKGGTLSNVVRAGQ
jgi:phosphoglycerate dehydrogenase-like enzyme